jgi:amino acid adenylation domain-containing protein
MGFNACHSTGNVDALFMQDTLLVQCVMPETKHRAREPFLNSPINSTQSAATAAGATPPLLLHWLANAAQRWPNTVALKAPGTQHTYAQLHTAVDTLTKQLLANGVAPGDRVAIAADRQAGTIIAILAVVQAGAAYVPLDLNYPAERLRDMLHTAQPRMVLGSEAALAQLRNLTGEFPTLGNPAPRAATAPYGAQAGLTYVLFTSGSTGTPKGVAMGDLPLRNLIAWHAAHPRLGQSACTLQFAPLSFDVHFQEIFSTIACGGALVLIEETKRRDPSLLVQALIEHHIERLYLPYVALQMIAQAATHSTLVLRDVISAGEQLQITPAIRSLFERLPGANLHNHYGPTETHVVTAHELAGDPIQWPDIPPIGVPLPYVRVALRDDTGVLTQSEGELLLGGQTLAHGYLGRQDLSQERFQSLQTPAGLWYVTGDLVRSQADDTLTYLGRADQQLKVDGFRIEPGEIELALMAYPAIKDAVVAAPDIAGAGKQLVAYVVQQDTKLPWAELTTALRTHLNGRLPAYMVPARFIALDKLPTTPSGKIDRRALPVPAAVTLSSAKSPHEMVASAWRELLGLEKIDPHQNLFDLGARSLLVMRFIAQLQAAGITQVGVADVYDTPTVAAITTKIEGQSRPQPGTHARQQPAQRTNAIAIVGMATRTAGAQDVTQFWQNLLQGREGIRHFALHELDNSIPESVRNRPNFVAARGVVEDAARFDAAFFGLSAREAVLLDPQQRMLLELAWSALEHANIDPTRSTLRIGVYAGTANNSYTPAMREQAPETIRQAGDFAVMLASEKDYAATRIANRLNLNGPAVSIHTACSTGLVAVAQAWHALAAGQCDAALAGGATLIVPQEGGYLHVEGAMESADGHCRPFDAKASGTVFASGGAMVMLKRLEDAQQDGDTIYAVIRGVGLNNDGGEKASFTAPSVRGQAQAIAMALDHAQVDARSIGYVEAHGTGTALGDPIEIAALTQAWQTQTADKQFCAIGSLKSNLGHTIAAAGVLGLIKAALALHEQQIPRTLHFAQANPHINFDNTPFYVTATNQAWPRTTTPRRAAISSFGVGGTNAHLVIEEAPMTAHTIKDHNPEAPVLLPISAKSESALQARAQQLAQFLSLHPNTSLQSLGYTLASSRAAMPVRATVAARTTVQALAALQTPLKIKQAGAAPQIVFLFPGQGSQHLGMAGNLYAQSDVFKDALERCLSVVKAELGTDLLPYLINDGPSDSAQAQELAQTKFAQPALFAMHYALATWLQALGVKPDAMIGHSIGEYAAACMAGVLSMEDAAKAVVARGLAMAKQTPGSMLAVKTNRERVQSLLPAEIEIAGLNAPALTVVAGPHKAIDAFAMALEQHGIESTRLKVSHAFHSAAMQGALPAVAKAMQKAQLHAPVITLYSCVTGTPLTQTQACDPHYWAEQVRAPVSFSRAVSTELAKENTLFIEVGPSQALSALIRQHRTPKGQAPTVITLLPPANAASDNALHAVQAIGQAWSLGVNLRWPTLGTSQRLTLPTYPFQGEHHWFKPEPKLTVAQPHSAELLTASTANLTQDKPNSQDTPKVLTMSRIPNLQSELLRVMSEVSGIAPDELAVNDTFMNQGLDSLSLTQATLEIERVFGAKLRFRRLLEDLDSVEKLAQFLDENLPKEKFTPPAAPSPAPAIAAPTQAVSAAPIMHSSLSMPAAVQGSAVQQIIAQQMQLMSQQLALLSGQTPVQSIATQPLQTASTAAVPTVPASPSSTTASVSSAESTQPGLHALVEKPFGASARITLSPKQELTKEQQEWLKNFITRYNARSSTSKKFSQENRALMADPRVVTGFNPLWKDLVYPIVVDRSKGASLWDLDGNEYIDLLSCFGANFLGYQPDDVVQAMVEQLQRGIEVGPQHPLSADVAQLIAEFTGAQRVAFCNTGSEAVMGAMRMARTVTGKKTIAIFTNSYHGIFDEVIVRGTKQLRSLSAAPGILANAVENILVLDWASEESLRILRERAHELAAIMTEPVQNKYPTIQPREFLHALRSIADDAGCALIFDEVVTGFRLAPGGAQEFYGVRADICTYGKIIGGGLPFAAIAGRKVWMDALDGGTWQYGDDSYPEAGVTYFAGTFVRHPLALAAARASLLHIKSGGAQLYHDINQRTQHFIERLNTAFVVRGAPVKAVHCASLWRLAWDDGQQFISLFYYLARYHGLHLYEQFGHFVTEAMDETHLERIFTVFTQCLDELMALGLITPRDGLPPPVVSTNTTTKNTYTTASAAALSGQAPHTGPSSLQTSTLAPGQQERWLVAAFDANARRALNESFYILFEGSVHLPALKMALQDVISRHDAFRLKFNADEPVQTVAPTHCLTVQEVDLSDQPDAILALEEFCAKAGQTDFLVEQAPLAAINLISLQGGGVAVHLVASHLIFDGWASAVFISELAAAYRARCAGQAPAFKAATSVIQFAQQENARFEGAVGQEALAYWKKQLTGLPPVVELGDRAAPSPRLYQADTVHLRVDEVLTTELRQAARRNSVTLFQFLFSAVSACIHRLSQRNDFVVCVPYAGQALEAHGPLIADGVLDLPVRMHCQPEHTGKQIVQASRQQLIDALEYPSMTQGTVARALGLRSTGDRPAITGIFFNLNPKVDLSGFAPLQVTMKEGRKQGTLHELFFNFYDRTNCLTLDLHYSADLFSRTRAEEICNALHQICQALPSQLDSPVSKLPPIQGPKILTVDERLLRWNSTQAPLQAGARIEQLISHQARITPKAIAVQVAGQTISYEALEARANQFARALHARGVGPGKLAGVCLGRGPELLPSLLGILKTGAAYVPLDPGFPRDRLHYMAQDANVAVVITEMAHIDLCGVSPDKRLLIDADIHVLSEASTQTFEPKQPLAPNTAAYVIYTSGSTGKPKGVAVPQNAVCNFLVSMRKTPGISQNDRLLAVTTLSFDIAVLELFLPLTVGAQVVIAQRDQAMDGDELIRLISEHSITLMQATPTTWHMLLDAGWHAPKQFKALCGGEPLPLSLARQLFNHGIELWNMYGPTETTVWSTLSRITNPNEKITIGKPIDNTQVWILDENLALCPVGSEGEICIGGEGVALGYFNRSELTAQRFITDPFNKTSEARLYRTGDLGRWREDGTLEHLGRMDFQVKIHGYRIELGEIEAQLDLQPGVARSVVMAREDAPGDIRLVGYVVSHGGDALDAKALRNALRSTLPHYMLPQHIVFLNTLPLLPNGKVDRKSLPAPDNTTPPTQQHTAAALSTGLESAVLQAMRDVLKVNTLSADEDFFSAGGNSLLAARLTARLKKDLKSDLNLRAVFSAPTARKLAQLIEQQKTTAQNTSASIDIQRRTDQTRAPLTVMQERIRFVEEMLPGRVMYNLPSVHRLTGPMDLEAFARAFDTIVQRQPALRTAIVATETGYEQRVQDLSFSLLPPQDLSSLPGQQKQAQLMAQLESITAEPFKLDQVPLFKAKLFKMSEQEHVLFFMPHHIVWDGWSFDVFYAEMSTLYKAYSSGESAQVVPLPITYSDYAHWHTQWLTTDTIKQQINSWKKHYMQSAPPSPVSGDVLREFASNGKGETTWLHLDNQRVQALREIAKHTGSTLNIVCLSLYAALVSQWLDEPSPAIGIPVRGRSTVDLEPAMGLFNNMLSVRLSPDYAASALTWISQVRNNLADAFAFQDIPFELLVCELPKDSPLYQVMFSFQDARARETHWGNLHHERIKLLQKGTTDDINLWMVELPSGIEGGIHYNAELFLPETIEALKTQYLALIDALISNADQTLQNMVQTSQLALPANRQRILGASKKNLDVFASLERFTNTQPNEHAIEFEGTTISYAQLWQLLNEVKPMLVQARNQGAKSTLVSLPHPLTSLLGCLCSLYADLPCLPLREEHVLAQIQQSGSSNTVCLISPWTADFAALPCVTWCDPSPLFSLLGQTQLSQDYAIYPESNATSVALSTTLLHSGIRGLLAQSHLLKNDAACVFTDAPTQTALTVASLAWTQGVCFKMLPFINAAAQLSNYQTGQAPVGLLFARSTQWKALIQQKVLPTLDLTVLVDATETSAPMISGLLSAGCTVLSSFGALEVGVPVAASVITRPEDQPIFGTPFDPITFEVKTKQGLVQPAGARGVLYLTINGHLIPTAWQARMRSDGQFQITGKQSAGQAASIPATSSTVPSKPLLSAVQTRVATVQSSLTASNDSALSTTQQLLSQVWQELLSVDRVDLTDNFFDLGGSSLLAMQAAKTVEQQLGRKISPRRYIFETLEQLAHAYDSEPHAAQALTAKDESRNLPAAPDTPSLARRIRHLVGLR